MTVFSLFSFFHSTPFAPNKSLPRSMLCATDPVSVQTAAHSNHHPSSPPPPLQSETMTMTAPSPHITLMHDPYDPRINVEYENLVHKWTDCLLTKSRSAPLHDSAAIIDATTSAMSTHPAARHSKAKQAIDGLLAEQWLEAQRILSCAQAWNTRESLSIEEAVHTMNILGLRMMQRSLSMRHNIDSRLHLTSLEEEDLEPKTAPDSTDEPKFSMPSFDSKSLLDEAITIPRFSLSLSLDEDDEHEMHAPLLRRHQQPSDGSISRASVASRRVPSTKDRQQQPPVNHADVIEHPHGVDRQRAPLLSKSPVLSTPARRPFRLVQSPSAPSCSESALRMERENCYNNFAPANNQFGYYPNAWRPLPAHDAPSEHDRHISISSSSSSSSTATGSSNDGDGESTWKSWFNHTHHAHKQRLCIFCCNPVAKKSMSTGDAEDAAASRLLSSSSSSSGSGSGASAGGVVFSGVYTSDRTNQVEEGCGGSSAGNGDSSACNALATDVASSVEFHADAIVRSESSISAFRPISKNLAPRCSPPMSAQGQMTSRWRCRREVSSSIAEQQQQAPTITKSQSFPSKVASLASNSNKPTTYANTVPAVPVIRASSATPVSPATATASSPSDRPIVDKGPAAAANKERNFVMRSIVSKKASLSKLFSGGKK